MKDTVDLDCKQCNGEGETYHYLVNYKNKTLYFDWQYCTLCYPLSSGVFPDNMDEIDSVTFNTLLKEGYKQLDL